MKIHGVTPTPDSLRRAADGMWACAGRVDEILADAFRLSAADTWSGPAADDLAEALRRCQGDLQLVWFHFAAHAHALRNEANAGDVPLAFEPRRRAQ
jgi:hypothetical protein